MVQPLSIQRQQQQQKQQLLLQQYHRQKQQNQKPFHQGRLYKRRDYFTNSWNSRWFILQNSQEEYFVNDNIYPSGLIYYAKKEDAIATNYKQQPRGIVCLAKQRAKSIEDTSDATDSIVPESTTSSDTVIAINNELNFRLSKKETLHAFTIKQGNQTMHLATLSECDRDVWIKKLVQVVYSCSSSDRDVDSKKSNNNYYSNTNKCQKDKENNENDSGWPTKIEDALSTAVESLSFSHVTQNSKEYDKVCENDEDGNYKADETEEIITPIKNEAQSCIGSTNDIVTSTATITNAFPSSGSVVTKDKKSQVNESVKIRWQKRRESNNTGTCCICYKDSYGKQMESCECGNKDCNKVAHVKCVSSNSLSRCMPSTSYPGTTTSRLPVVLCGNVKQKSINNNQQRLPIVTRI